MLYGPDGELLEGAGTDPGLRGGWRASGSIGEGSAHPGRYGVNRDQERDRCRRLYFTNPLFGSAIDIAVSFLLGDEFGYGDIHDRTLREAVEDFWSLNDLGVLVTERWLTQYFLDGEDLTVFPDAALSRDEPARIAQPDVALGLRLEFGTTRGVTAAHVPGENLGELSFPEGRFAWTANSSLWNDPRGFPVALRAADASEAYVTLLNHRVNVHELQQRLLAKYKAFVTGNTAEERQKALTEKAQRYGRIPRKGSVLTLAMMQDKDGRVVSEDLEFLTPGQGAANAETDARAILRLAGLAIGGLPEHWLGEGGNANRATAGEMSLPAIRLAQRRQATVRSYLNRLMRLELVRRFGPDKRYRVARAEVSSADRLTRKIRTQLVPVTRLEIPWNLPALTVHALGDLIRLAQVAASNNWASPQTLAARLGFDPALEAELLAQIGLVFGQARRAEPTAATARRPGAPNPAPADPPADGGATGPSGNDEGKPNA